ncbi:hypothetical protein ONZ51_g12274 [Trametes cubensis]|uniref:Uncharacterized protein n=1 Tax=Trametes cubensis TaxID=1111947 RepID=A0AAD7X3M9_9APHY|nr:hypothetical protein ONZ51_g12274 [Trametes cubensis]
MHNLFLGELRHHCRDVWGINVKDKSSDSPKMLPHTPDEQREWLRKVVPYIRDGSHSRLSRVRKGYIVAVAELNGARRAHRDTEIQVPPVLAEATKDFRLVRDEYDISRFSVLDQATVTRLREDINATTFPSWMERPPRNFGSPSHGKLKADLWRTSQYLATRRSTNQARIDKFDEHMREYLRSLRDLPDHQFVPNHHLSLHLKECLELFGPVHTWWAFPFEHFNGILQRLNTNSKSDEMPLTFMQYFYLGTNIRSLMEDTGWPDLAPFRAMRAAYEDAIRDTVRGTRLADFYAQHSRDSDEAIAPQLPTHQLDEHRLETMPRDHYQSLFEHIVSLDGPIFAPMLADVEDRRPRLPDTAQYLTAIQHQGLTYSTCKSAYGNSLVLFRSPDRQDHHAAGRICDILLHGRDTGANTTVDAFVVLEEFVPLSSEHAAADPFHQYPDLETRLFYNCVESSCRIVPLNDIVCHFASLLYTPETIKEECVVN